jgi:plastocyanin
MPARSGVGVALVACLCAAPPAGYAGAQGVMERSPNVSGDWSGVSGTLYFHFLHRFTRGDAPARKVTSSPTFLVAAGLPRRTLLGFNYATNSDVAASYPNEWEFFGRLAPLTRATGAPLDVGLQAGYNLAATSMDGEVTLGREFGALRLRAAARYLSDAFDLGESRAVLAGSGVLHLGSYVALAGDVASMLDRPTGYDVAWSAALQLEIPNTPHSLSLQYTNVNTATLQGSSAARGNERRFGFEFTIPVTLSRYVGSRRSSQRTATDTSPGAVQVVMRDNQFVPARVEVTAGTVVEWTNQGARDHTVTSDDRSWDSGSIAPGSSWRHRFDRPGTYAIHCEPHPSMRGVVVVR